MATLLAGLVASDSHTINRLGLGLGFALGQSCFS